MYIIEIPLNTQEKLQEDIYGNKQENSMNEYIATLNRDLIDYQRKTAHTAEIELYGTYDTASTTSATTN